MKDTLVFDFPVRPNGTLVQIVIPSDLTKEEADRLCAFVKSLAVAPSQQTVKGEAK